MKAPGEMMTQMKKEPACRQQMKSTSRYDYAVCAKHANCEYRLQQNQAA
jgi:hypothetical protein